jgi:hypothetical protein
MLPLEKRQKERPKNLFTLQFPSLGHFELLVGSTANSMNDALSPEQLAQALGSLQAQLNDLQRRDATRTSDPPAVPRDVQLSAEVAAAIPAHLQIAPADAAQRKRLVANYPKSDDLPKPLNDGNGLASKMLGESKERKYLLSVLPSVQRDALDCTRVAASAWQMALAMPNPEERADFLLAAVRDLAVLSVDTAQRAADAQIKGIFESSGHKGALSFVRTAPDGDIDLDLGDTNIIQACHVDAVKELSSFAKDIKANSRNGGSAYQNRNGRGSRGGQRFGGGHRGGKGGGGYNTSWRQGNGYRGRNNRGNNNNRGNSDNNNNNGNSSSNNNSNQ